MERDVVHVVTRGDGVFAGHELLPTGRHQVLAIDRLDRWVGSFAFSIGRRGTAATSGDIWEQQPDGRWSDLSSGGATWGGWETPWQPPADGWHGSPILRMGCAGRDVEVVDSDEWAFLSAHVGFVQPGITAIEVRDERGRRTVEVTSAVGAYVALAFGDTDRVAITPVTPGAPG